MKLQPLQQIKSFTVKIFDNHSYIFKEYINTEIDHNQTIPLQKSRWNMKLRKLCVVVLVLVSLSHWLLFICHLFSDEQEDSRNFQYFIMEVWMFLKCWLISLWWKICQNVNWRMSTYFLQLYRVESGRYCGRCYAVSGILECFHLIH